ncbi:hypothetical protein SAMN04489724_0377 [Algoriphagus locisalis]|uniref:Uncharacterized protein n=1 Tax=Algoriphagus locisalis TaxID=305507 RepID=A0A1I7EAB9_9BACT|nr:hypothetical protein SAMN04489724_0377 [Algoriphagus locisalis]
MVLSKALESESSLFKFRKFVRTAVVPAYSAQTLPFFCSPPIPVLFPYVKKESRD